jgi:hypothetical protein
MNVSQILGVYQIEEGARKIEINPKRVVEWVLIFTNIFFIGLFFSRLFHIT